jgi:hypothetical protein
MSGVDEFISRKFPAFEVPQQLHLPQNQEKRGESQNNFSNKALNQLKFKKMGQSAGRAAEILVDFQKDRRVLRFLHQLGAHLRQKKPHKNHQKQ